MTVTSLPTNSFLSDVSVFQVDGSGRLDGSFGSPLETLANLAIETGSAEVAIDGPSLPEETSAAIAIPVHRAGRVVSVVLLSSKKIDAGSDRVVGVFEAWEPIAPYEEVALKTGFYGKMERFHNVSSFVRFEKGSGLPGQVWQQYQAVIHDDLANHPGFLRAAGASADLLRTAIGIPVFAGSFRCAAVLISSLVSPIARGFEVWRAEQDGFSLASGVYDGLANAFQRDVGDELSPDQGLPGLTKAKEAALLCDDIDRLLAGRACEEGEQPTSALAIPFYERDSLTSVTTLLF